MSEGFLRLMDTEAGFIELVNLGNPDEFTIRELAEEVIGLTGSSSKLVFHPLAADDPMPRQPDISLARQKLGWEPKVRLKEGPCHTIAYFDELLSGAQ